jgi:hypothetical protein
MTAEQIFLPYAKVAFEIKNELLTLERSFKLEKEAFAKAILKKQISTLNHLLNVCFRVTGDFTAVSVSVKAKNYIDKNNLGDIFEIGWGDQLKFEKKKIRTECELIHEHKTPVKSLIEKLKTAQSLEETIEIFKLQQIVWIHKDEDKLLPKSNRPDPDDAYRKAGIEILQNNKPIGHIFRRKIKK